MKCEWFMWMVASSWTAVIVILSTGTASMFDQINPPECVTKPEYRTYCGVMESEITRDECRAMDCCWETSHNGSACFQKNYACSVPSTRRRPCGEDTSLGDSVQCLDMGCCWDASKRTKCFHNVYYRHMHG